MLRYYFLEPRPGFEPGTSALPERRSTRLSYRGLGSIDAGAFMDYAIKRRQDWQINASSSSFISLNTPISAGKSIKNRKNNNECQLL